MVGLSSARSGRAKLTEQKPKNDVSVLTKIDGPWQKTKEHEKDPVVAVSEHTW
jgi:hypothetical protein